MPLRAWLFALFDALTIERENGLDTLAVSAPWPLPGGPALWDRVGPALYRARDASVSTATLAAVDGDRFWVDGDSYRAVPSWRFHGLRFALASSLFIGPVALVATIVQVWRGRQRLAFAWACVAMSSGSLWVLFAVFVSVGLLGELADSSTLGRLSLASGALLVASAGVPLWALAAAGLARGVHERPLALQACIAALVGCAVVLAANGWLPLRTWVGS